MTIPPGLIALKDLIDRAPRDREVLLAYEIRKRERERLLYGSTRQLMRMHLWSNVKSLLLWIVTVFSIILTVGALSDFGRWLQNAGRYTLNLPPPLPQHYQIDLSSLIPTSTVITAFARLPNWNWQNALAISLFIAGVILVEKVILGYFTLHKAKQLNDAGRELDEEVKVLREWQHGQIDGKAKNG